MTHGGSIQNLQHPEGPWLALGVLEAMRSVAGLGANPASLHAPGRRARGVVDAAAAAVGRAVGRPGAEVIFVASPAEAALLTLPGLRSDGDAAPPGGQTFGLSPGLFRKQPQAIAALRSRGHAVLALVADRLGPVGAAGGMDRLWLEVDEWPLEPAAAKGSVHPFLGKLGSSGALVLDVGSALRCRRQGLPATWSASATLTLWGPEIGGPPGLGAVVLQKGYTVTPLWGGGAQANGLRPGTEAFMLCAGLQAALS